MLQSVKLNTFNNTVSKSPAVTPRPIVVRELHLVAPFVSCVRLRHLLPRAVCCAVSSRAVAAFVAPGLRVPSRRCCAFSACRYASFSCAVAPFVHRARSFVGPFVRRAVCCAACATSRRSFVGPFVARLAPCRAVRSSCRLLRGLRLVGAFTA